MATSDDIKHRKIYVNCINMHVAEKGEEGDPIILFIHGFPELWYSWRHQIHALSGLGYRTIAPDLRDYSDTDIPLDTRTYTFGHVVGDMVALLDVLEAQEVFVVGHDWGAMISWWLCLFRPDRVEALVNLSVAFFPRNPTNTPIKMFRAAFGVDYYICLFQEPGDIECEIDEAGGADKFLRKFFTYTDPAPMCFPEGDAFKDLPPYPTWLLEEDVAYYLEKFTKSGFTGGLNYYRMIDLYVS